MHLHKSEDVFASSSQTEARESGLAEVGTDHLYSFGPVGVDSWKEPL